LWYNILMKNYKEKKVYLDLWSTNKRRKTSKKYCLVRIYNSKKDVQNSFKEYLKQGGRKEKVNKNLVGVHNGYEKFKIGSKKPLPETGTVRLCKQNLGAGVVTHELMHAVLWSRIHSTKNNQYPIIIKSMKEEEEILGNHTLAVQQFYKWYWKIEKSLL